MDEAHDTPDARDDDYSSGGHNHSVQTADERLETAAGYRSRKGWDAGGHRAVVCSRCCIERGAEGDVTCLGCLSKIESA